MGVGRPHGGWAAWSSGGSSSGSWSSRCARLGRRRRREPGLGGVPTAPTIPSGSSRALRPRRDRRAGVPPAAGGHPRQPRPALTGTGRPAEVPWPPAPVPWPTAADQLTAEQERLGGLRPPAWRPTAGTLVTARFAGCFVAFLRGEEGPGRAGDRAWTGAVLWRDGRELARVALMGRTGAPYVPGSSPAREGALVRRRGGRAAGSGPTCCSSTPTGRDPPPQGGSGAPGGRGARRAHRRRDPFGRCSPGGPNPAPSGAATSPLTLDGDVVARWVRTVTAVRPVVAHAAWCTGRRHRGGRGPGLLRPSAGGGLRTPEPLRLARHLARQPGPARPTTSAA